VSRSEQSERHLTPYQVFRVEEDGRWTPLGEHANSAGIYAIQALADEPGDFRAVPLRNITEQAMGYEEPPPPKLVPVIGRKTVVVSEAEEAEEAEAAALADQVLNATPEHTRTVRGDDEEQLAAAIAGPPPDDDPTRVSRP
jgi:hypothetical protein